MTTRPLVVDTSVAVKWFLDEPGSPHARRIRSALQRNTYRLLIPAVIYAEFANVMWKRVRSRQLDPGDGAAMIEAFVALPADVVPIQSLLPPAYRIACDLDCPVYDALFLALAREADASMVTADERLLRAAHPGIPGLTSLAAWGERG